MPARSPKTPASAPRCRPSRPALDAGAAVMVTSHLGRPTEGEFKPEDSLAPIAAAPVRTAGPAPCALVQNWVDGVDVAPGQVVLLENCRLNKGEKKNERRTRPEDGQRCATSTSTTPSAPRTAPRPPPTASRKYAPRWPAPARCWRAEIDAHGPRRWASPKPARWSPSWPAPRFPHQADHPQVPGGQGGPADRRRRHRQHLPAGRRPEDRQVAGRARPRRRRAGRSSTSWRAAAPTVPIPVDVVCAKDLQRPTRRCHRQGRQATWPTTT